MGRRCWKIPFLRSFVRSFEEESRTGTRAPQQWVMEATGRDEQAVPGSANSPAGSGMAEAMSSRTGSLIAAMSHSQDHSQEVGTGSGRSGKALLTQLRVRHAVDRSMSSMRDDMQKMFGQDIDEDGEKDLASGARHSRRL
eukprot:COSAG02_NODE_5398_length_4363_cov_4.830675_3_plen_140_part_00